MASTSPKRGELWLVQFGAAKRGEPGKNRPAIVVSSDHLLSDAPGELVVVIPVSSQLQGSGLRPTVTEDDGVERDSVANVAGVRGVARDRLLSRLGVLTDATMTSVEWSLTTVLGLDLPDGVGA